MSRIYLDRAAAAAQTRALAATLQTVLGPQAAADAARRHPGGAQATGASFSARGAGVLGHDRTSAATTSGRSTSEGDPTVEALEAFLAKHGDAPFLIFGFTFMVWLYLYEVARDDGLDLCNGILIHSGGWKKLIDQAVDNAEFRRRLADDTGLRRIHNFYGMVEQIGTVFLEGPEGGSLYCPDFADVVIRDPQTWAEPPLGEPGLIEVVSTLPTSYPGHVLLTEDLGVVARRSTTATGRASASPSSAGCRGPRPAAAATRSPCGVAGEGRPS